MTTVEPESHLGDQEPEPTITEEDEVQPVVAPEPMPEEMYTVEHVANLFSVTPETVRRWIRKGELEAMKPGGLIRVKRSEVLRFGNSKYGPS